jgi:hypothetical protein
VPYPESILTDELLVSLERDPDDVRDDVRSGRLSLEDARWIFGSALELRGARVRSADPADYFARNTPAAAAAAPARYRSKMLSVGDPLNV